MTIDIVIADDHGLVRSGLRSLLNAQPDLRAIGEAADGNEALQLVEGLHPDVLLADISMLGPSGIEIARTLRERASSTHILVLTMHEDPALAREAVLAGARGYVVKRAAAAELITAIRVVAEEGT